MPQSQAALTFAQWGRPRVPHSPPGWYQITYALWRKRPFAAFARVDQSVTERYNFVGELGLPVSPSKAARLFSCLRPGRMRFLM
jgi:hypothetical protein